MKAASQSRFFEKYGRLGVAIPSPMVLQMLENKHGIDNVVTDLDINGRKEIFPPHLLDTEASDDTIYFSEDAAKLVYKDDAGTVHNLY